MRTGKTILAIFFGLFAIAVALPFVMPYFSSHPGSEAGFKLKVGLGMSLVLAGCGWLVIHSMNKNTRRAQELLAEPQRIAWVFGVNQSVNGIPTAKPVQLLALDGTAARLAAGNQTTVLMALQRELPHAIFGYGTAQAAEFDRRASAS